MRAHGNVHIYVPYFFLRKVYEFLNFHRICEHFCTYVIVTTHGIQIDHKKCINVRFEKKSVPTGVLVYNSFVKANSLISRSAKLAEGAKTTTPVHDRFLMSKCNQAI